MPRLTDEAVAVLTKFPRLESLHLRCNSRITNKALSALADARRLTTRTWSSPGT